MECCAPGYVKSPSIVPSRVKRGLQVGDVYELRTIHLDSLFLWMQVRHARHPQDHILCLAFSTTPPPPLPNQLQRVRAVDASGEQQILQHIRKAALPEQAYQLIFQYAAGLCPAHSVSFPSLRLETGRRCRQSALSIYQSIQETHSIQEWSLLWSLSQLSHEIFWDSRRGRLLFTPRNNAFHLHLSYNACGLLTTLKFGNHVLFCKLCPQ